MQHDTGPTQGDRDGDAEIFDATVSSLAGGGLLFPPPFDVASAAALASNIDRGEIALNLFSVTAMRSPGFKVQIFAEADGETREVIDTKVNNTRMLIVLLEGLLEELHDQEED